MKKIIEIDVLADVGEEVYCVLSTTTNGLHITYTVKKGIIHSFYIEYVNDCADILSYCVGISEARV